MSSYHSPSGPGSGRWVISPEQDILRRHRECGLTRMYSSILCVSSLTLHGFPDTILVTWVLSRTRPSSMDLGPPRLSIRMHHKPSTTISYPICLARGSRAINQLSLSSSHNYISCPARAPARVRITLARDTTLVEALLKSIYSKLSTTKWVLAVWFHSRRSSRLSRTIMCTLMTLPTNGRCSIRAFPGPTHTGTRNFLQL